MPFLGRSPCYMCRQPVALAFDERISNANNNANNDIYNDDDIDNGPDNNGDDVDDDDGDHDMNNNNQYLCCN